jgi:hypothetical protein
MNGHNLHKEAFTILISTKGIFLNKRVLRRIIQYYNQRKRKESFVHIYTSSDIQTCDYSYWEVQYLMRHTEYYIWNWKCTLITSVALYNSTYLHNLGDGFCLNSCVCHLRTEQVITVRVWRMAGIFWRTVHMPPYFLVSNRPYWFLEVF